MTRMLLLLPLIGLSACGGRSLAEDDTALLRELTIFWASQEEARAVTGEHPWIEELLPPAPQPNARRPAPRCR